jgi:hypothetical protein
MLHFASHFLAQQLICCVHVFGCKNSLFVSFVPRDHESPRRREVKRPQPHPRATARVPAPHHSTPALTKIRKNASPPRSLCKGGGSVDEWMGPLRSPWGGALPLA